MHPLRFTLAPPLKMGRACVGIHPDVAIVAVPPLSFVPHCPHPPPASCSIASWIVLSLPTSVTFYMVYVLVILEVCESVFMWTLYMWQWFYTYVANIVMGVLSIFFIDIRYNYVYLDVALCSHIYCIWLIWMFHVFCMRFKRFQVFFTSVLDVWCKCFYSFESMFHLDISDVDRVLQHFSRLLPPHLGVSSSSIFQVFFYKCFKCMMQMLQRFRMYVANVFLDVLHVDQVLHLFSSLLLPQPGVFSSSRCWWCCSAAWVGHESFKWHRTWAKPGGRESFEWHRTHVSKACGMPQEVWARVAASGLGRAQGVQVV